MIHARVYDKRGGGRQGGNEGRKKEKALVDHQQLFKAGTSTFYALDDLKIASDNNICRETSARSF